MIYREYRPQKFSEIIGNNSIVNSITSSFKNDDFAHAYFFHGGRGTGKTTTARLIAKILNCQNLQYNEDINNHIQVEPCNQCDNCKQIKKNTFVDLIELDAASNRGIENIKELIETVKFSPTSGKKKVYIIDEVHMLTKEASNALLKTLEEPPENVHFILCTTNPEKVIDTIKSRCIQYNFLKPDTELIKTKLQKIIKDKKIDIDDSQLHQIAIDANGAFRDAETLLEQFIYNIGSDEQHQSLTKSYYNFLVLFVKKDYRNLINLLHFVVSTNTNFTNWTVSLLSYIRNIQLYKIGALDSLYLDKDDILLSKSVKNRDLVKLVSAISRSDEFNENLPIPSLSLEIALLKLFVDDLEDNFDPDAIDQVQVDIDFENSTTKNTDINNNSDNNQKNLEGLKNTKKNVGKINKKETKSVKKKNLNKVKSKNEDDLSQIKNTVLTPELDSDIVIPKTDIEVPTKIVNINFSYEKFLNRIQQLHPTIYLILRSCSFHSIENNVVVLVTKYDFHKDRISTLKNLTKLEKVAKNLTKADIKIECRVVDSTTGQGLTDKNVIEVKKNINEIFSDVFGQEIKQKSHQSN